LASEIFKKVINRSFCDMIHFLIVFHAQDEVTSGTKFYSREL